MRRRILPVFALLLLLPACAQDDPVGPFEAQASEVDVQGKPVLASAYNLHTLIGSNSLGATWPEARDWVVAYYGAGGGAHLAFIGSRLELRAALALIKASTYRTCWIGLHYDMGAQAFLWADGTPLGDFANWAPGEPRFPGPVYMTLRGKWYAVPVGTVNSMGCMIVEDETP